jgi:hypothetical protein
MRGIVLNVLNIVLRIKKGSLVLLPIFKALPDMMLKIMLLLLLLEVVLILKIGCIT